VLGDMPKGTLQLRDTLWVKHPLGTCGGGTHRCPCSGGASEAAAHQSVAGPGESHLGPQGGMGGDSRSRAAPQQWAAEPSPAAGARGAGAPQEGAHCIAGSSRAGQAVSG